MVQLNSNGELYHHGIEGQKHGVRRFQNIDGSLTPEGKIRYGVEDAKELVENKKVKEEPKKEEPKKEEAEKANTTSDTTSTSTKSSNKKKKKGSGSGKKIVVKANAGKTAKELRSIMVSKLAHTASEGWHYVSYQDVLVHHGILGMKWGIRRWQNEDGTLTAAGYRHYGKHPEKASDAQLAKVKARYQTEADIKRLKDQINPASTKTQSFAAEKMKSLANKFADKGIDKLVDKIYSGKKKKYDLTSIDLDKIKDPEVMKAVKQMMLDKKVAEESRTGYNEQRYSEEKKYSRWNIAANKAEEKQEEARARAKRAEEKVEKEWAREDAEEERKKYKEAAKSAYSWYANNYRDMTVNGFVLGSRNESYSLPSGDDERDKRVWSSFDN